ncbi:AAA family ATPase [Enterobacter wuhouensis]|uniref:AAA family ATPase n=1 Tax=Enterobacter wuhouensis TaxID=2529381 RepID=UPI002FD4124D
MELIALYIGDFNGVLDSFIKLSSKFSFKYDHKSLTIREGIDRDIYYDYIPSTLLIGQNGTGKTTILTYIEDFHYENENTGFMVWYSNEKIYVTCKGIQPSHISTHYSTKIIYNTVDFFTENDIFTIKSNNTVDFNSYLFGSRKGTAKNFIDISLSNTGRGKSNKKQEIAKIAKFINAGRSLPDTINQDKISILARLSLTGAKRTKAILKDSDFRNKYGDMLISLFNHYYEKYSNTPTPYGYPSKEYQFIKYNDFISYTNFKNNNWGLTFFSFIFSKLSSDRELAQSLSDVIFFTLTSILYSFSKKLTSDKHNADFLYLKFVVALFFSNGRDYIKEIEFTIKDHAVVADEDKVIKELIKLKKDVNLVQEIIYKLYNSNDKIRINELELSFYINSPGIAADLISMSNALPKEFDALFSIEWNGLSSGEVSLLHLFSSLYNSIDKINSSKNKRKILLLLDEIDLYLHPEWQRKIFSDILDMLNEFNETISFQIIMSSHSPIIASDFLPVDIISLTRGHNREIVTGTLESIGFGESIEKTMSQGFFLKATVGERVLKKVEELVKRKNDRSFINDNKYITSLIKNKFLTYILGVKND